MKRIGHTRGQRALVSAFEGRRKLGSNYRHRVLALLLALLVAPTAAHAFDARPSLAVYGPNQTFVELLVSEMQRYPALRIADSAKVEDAVTRLGTKDLGALGAALEVTLLMRVETEQRNGTLHVRATMQDRRDGRLVMQTELGAYEKTPLVAAERLTMRVLSQLVMSRKKRRKARGYDTQLNDALPDRRVPDRPIRKTPRGRYKRMLKGAPVDQLQATELWQAMAPATLNMATVFMGHFPLSSEELVYIGDGSASDVSFIDREGEVHDVLRRMLRKRVLAHFEFRKGHFHPALQLAVTLDSNKLAIHDYQSKETLARIELNKKKYGTWRGVRFSPDGKRLAVITRDGAGVVRLPKWLTRRRRKASKRVKELPVELKMVRRSRKLAHVGWLDNDMLLIAESNGRVEARETRPIPKKGAKNLNDKRTARRSGNDFVHPKADAFEILPKGGCGAPLYHSRQIVDLFSLDDPTRFAVLQDVELGDKDVARRLYYVDAYRGRCGHVRLPEFPELGPFQLVASGLMRMSPDGRSVIYFANFENAKEVPAFRMSTLSRAEPQKVGLSFGRDAKLAKGQRLAVVRLMSDRDARTGAVTRYYEEHVGHALVKKAQRKTSLLEVFLGPHGKVTTIDRFKWIDAEGVVREALALEKDTVEPSLDDDDSRLRVQQPKLPDNYIGDQDVPEVMPGIR